MSWFRARVDPRDTLIAALRAELSDLRAEYHRARDQFEVDRRELLDRVIALTSPLALREMRRTSPGVPPAPASQQYRRINYPGTDTRVAPPPPIQPVGPPPDLADEDDKGSTDERAG